MRVHTPVQLCQHPPRVPYITPLVQAWVREAAPSAPVGAPSTAWDSRGGALRGSAPAAAQGLQHSHREQHKQCQSTAAHARVRVCACAGAHAQDGVRALHGANGWGLPGHPHRGHPCLEGTRSTKHPQRRGTRGLGWQWLRGTSVAWGTRGRGSPGSRRQGRPTLGCLRCAANSP